MANRNSPETKPIAASMPDVASETDERGITIQKVGVRGIHLPIRIREKAGGYGRVLAQVDVSVDLAHYNRGTHMSRFVEILNRWSRRPVTAADLGDILEEICEAFRARRAEMTMRFKYFLDKSAPVSGLVSPLDYDCCFHGTLENGSYQFTLEVTVPITTLCPCSREISEAGAHSQRAELTVHLRTRDHEIFWIEDLVPILEAQGSAPVFPILKRQDEKWVTEHAYHNPKFVEDVVRDTILALREIPSAAWYSAECVSLESIHNHDAYAYAVESREADTSGEPESC